MAKKGHVLVGIGNEDERPVLDWAAPEAESRGCDLELVSVYPQVQQIWPWATPSERRITADLRDAAERRLTLARAHVETSWPDLVVRDLLVSGISTNVLIERSAGAAVTVVGSRRRRAIGAALLGSVSGAVAGGASGTAVVVPTAGNTQLGSEVVVGIAGFERTDVLEFAFGFAARHNCSLHAVYSWWDEYPTTVRWLERRAPERARHWLADLLSPWRHSFPTVELRQTETERPPTAALTEASQCQRLLVVGGHRSQHARLTSALGSVTQGVLHHAVVPVAVVHPRVTGDTVFPIIRTNEARLASSEVPGR